MNFYLKTALAMGVVIVGAVLMIVYLQGADERAIQKALDDAVEAANRFDADGTVAILSKKYDKRGEDYEKLAQRVRGAVDDRAYRKVTLTSSEIAVDGSAATVELTLKADLGMGTFPMGFRVWLAREGGVWRVTGYEEREILR